jgi:hypothetical protein
MSPFVKRERGREGGREGKKENYIYIKFMFVTFSQILELLTVHLK